MRPDSSENTPLFPNLEGKAVALGNPALPNILHPLHLFDAQRRVTGILQEERQLLFGAALNGFWKGLEIPLEPFGALYFSFACRSWLYRIPRLHLLSKTAVSRPDPPNPN